MDLVSVIANAIKKADNSYLFENYSKQAKAVMRALDQQGYMLVPKEPSKEMIKAGIYAINLGLVDARKLAKEVYKDMLEAAD